MSVETIITDLIPEKSTWRYTGVFVDETGAVVPNSQFSELKLTLYDLATLAIINSVSAVNILNTDRGAVDPAGNLTILFLPADAPILDTAVELETHIALLEWTYAGSTKAGRHIVRHHVVNLAKVA